MCGSGRRSRLQGEVAMRDWWLVAAGSKRRMGRDHEALRQRAAAMFRAAGDLKDDARAVRARGDDDDQ
jgi:hypothetical protein